MSLKEYFNSSVVLPKNENPIDYDSSSNEEAPSQGAVSVRSNEPTLSVASAKLKQQTTIITTPSSNEPSERLTKRFIAGLAEYGLTLEDMKKWKYCGGDTSSHQRYFSMVYPNKHVPAKVKQCICGVKIIENCYITNAEFGADYLVKTLKNPKDSNESALLIIGNCCIKKFVAKKGRTCEDCEEPHQNRIDNKCKDCRAKAKLKKKQQEQEQEENERLKRIIAPYINRIKVKPIFDNFKEEDCIIEAVPNETVKPKIKLCFNYNCNKQIDEKYKYCYSCLMKYREKISIKNL
jgi:hypothetical protein